MLLKGSLLYILPVFYLKSLMSVRYICTRNHLNIIRLPAWSSSKDKAFCFTFCMSLFCDTCLASSATEGALSLWCHKLTTTITTTNLWSMLVRVVTWQLTAFQIRLCVFLCFSVDRAACFFHHIYIAYRKSPSHFLQHGTFNITC